MMIILPPLFGTRLVFKSLASSLDRHVKDWVTINYSEKPFIGRINKKSPSVKSVTVDYWSTAEHPLTFRPCQGCVLNTLASDNSCTTKVFTNLMKCILKNIMS